MAAIAAAAVAGVNAEVDAGVNLQNGGADSADSADGACGRRARRTRLSPATAPVSRRSVAAQPQRLKTRPRCTRLAHFSAPASLGGALREEIKTGWLEGGRAWSRRWRRLRDASL